MQPPPFLPLQLALAALATPTASAASPPPPPSPSPSPSLPSSPSPPSPNPVDWFISHTSTPIRSLLAGGVAGCVAKTATAPLDRVKILFQGSNPNFHRFTQTWSGPFLAVWWIYQQQGLRACYKGHAATLARIFPYAALNFYCFEHYKRWITQYTTAHRIEGTAQQAMVSVLAGSMAGTTSVAFTYPLDYVHSRITYQVKIARYRGILQTIRSTLQEGVEQAKAERAVLLHERGGEGTGKGSRPDIRLPLPHLVYGVRKLYTGFGTTVMGIIPYAGVSFATYDTLKRLTLPHFPDGQVPLIIRLLWGAAAGAAAQTASYPLDVIRRRMQLFGLSSTLPHYRNTWHAARSIVHNEGVRGLFIGLSINYVKVSSPRIYLSANAHPLHLCSPSVIFVCVLAPAGCAGARHLVHDVRVHEEDAARAGAPHCSSGLADPSPPPSSSSPSPFPLHCGLDVGSQSHASSPPVYTSVMSMTFGVACACSGCCVYTAALARSVNVWSTTSS